MSSDYSEDHNDFIVELQSLYIACAIDLSCFFFFNQQFITQSVMADCGSYNITTLNRTKTKENKRKERERKAKVKMKNIVTTILCTHISFLEKAFGLYSKNNMN